VKGGHLLTPENDMEKCRTRGDPVARSPPRLRRVNSKTRKRTKRTESGGGIVVNDVIRRENSKSHGGNLKEVKSTTEGKEWIPRGEGHNSIR